MTRGWIIPTLLLVLVGCSDSTDPPPPAYTITGTVTDAAGQPVAGVALSLDYEGVVHEADKPSTMVRFVLPEAATARLYVTDACDDEVYHEWDFSEVQAGTHSVIWDGTDLDGKQVPEGAYNFHLDLPEGENSRFEAVLARNLEGEDGDFGQATCADVRSNWRLDAWTDDAGRFTIERACWDFGRTFTMTDEAGETRGSYELTSRFRVWAYPEGAEHGTAGAWTTMEPESGATVGISLP